MRKPAVLRVGSLGLTLALVFGLTACVSGNVGQTAPGIITVDGSEPQRKLLTTDTAEVGGGNILERLFTGLVRYELDGTPVFAIAESIEPNAESTEFHVRLRQDWTFHNGEPVTADSFINTWNFGANPLNQQTMASYFDMIQGYAELENTTDPSAGLSGLVKLNDYEFLIRLTQPESTFIPHLGDSRYAPWPQVAFDDIEKFGEAPIGSGPYKIASEDAWQHNVGMSLRKYDNYAGDNKAQNNGIDFIFYSSLDAAYTDLLSGNLDMMRKLPSNAASTYLTDFPDTSIQLPYAGNNTITIPERLEHFGNDEEGHLRRQAISSAIDRILIQEKILFWDAPNQIVDFGAPTLGKQDPVAGSDILVFNPERARELWAQADAINPWTGVFELAYNADGENSVWPEAVVNSISKTLGIQAQGRAYPLFRAMRDDIQSRNIQSAFRTGWQADFPTISNFLEPLYATSAASNDGDYSNPQFDALLAQAARESDPVETRRLYAEAQGVLMQDLPVIPLWYATVTGAWNPGLSNVAFSWNGTPVYEDIVKE